MTLPAPSERTTAIVTGASSGIGAEIARQLARRSHGVTLVARREDRLRILAEELAHAHGVRAEVIAADMTDPDARAALVDELEARGLTPDILVNNAGFSTMGPVQRADRARELAMVRTDVEAVADLCSLVLPGMVERGGGTIVTVGSVAAMRPGLIGGAPYGAAKAGVLNLMGHVHTVLRDKGIRATTVMPAEVDTPILANRPLPPDAAARATMMQAEDVARAIMLCVTLPERTVVEEIVLSPTRTRDQSRDIAVARDLGAPSRRALTPPPSPRPLPQGERRPFSTLSPSRGRR